LYKGYSKKTHKHITHLSAVMDTKSLTSIVCITMKLSKHLSNRLKSKCLDLHIEVHGHTLHLTLYGCRFMMLNNIQLYRGVQFYFGENRSARRKPPSRRKLLILSRNVVIEYTSP
jgi:hypothetical protein